MKKTSSKQGRRIADLSPSRFSTVPYSRIPTSFLDDKLHEECGIVGAFGAPAVDTAMLALHAVQHRGQESSGMAVSDGRLIRSHRELGLVSKLAQTVRTIPDFAGHMAIGHTRYSTTGSSNIKNSQPILVDYKKGQLAVAHNGNITNAAALRACMEQKGQIFQSTNDSEIILHLVARSKKPKVSEMVCDALSRLEGAFSVVVLTERHLMAARDPLGVRPLCLGRKGEMVIIASETCALDIVGAEYVRDIEPGELLVIEAPFKMRSLRFAPVRKTAQCIFEYIYFSRPDSRIFGHNVDKVRRALGRKLAEENPVDADIVIPVPDSSNTAALGYSQASGIPFEIGLIRNHYVGRTFISPVQQERDARVKIKFNIVRGVLKDKRVVVVEDSIVRGTTLRQLVKLIRTANPKEIHLRVSSPPVKHPCFHGMDFPSPQELIANRMSVQQTCEYLGADSLAHLSLKGLRACAGEDGDGFCYACFSGQYPGRCKETGGKAVFERTRK